MEAALICGFCVFFFLYQEDGLPFYFFLSFDWLFDCENELFLMHILWECHCTFLSLFYPSNSKIFAINAIQASAFSHWHDSLAWKNVKQGYTEIFQ